MLRLQYSRWPGYSSASETKRRRHALLFDMAVSQLGGGAV